MVGGDAGAFKAARAVMAHYGRAGTHMGGPGAGQLTKMVNQIAIAGLVQALAEAVNFGVRSGLDTGQVIDVISRGAVGSRQLENRAATMVEGGCDFGFAAAWMLKD